MLPLMVTLYLGTAEVSKGIAADRKVTMTARTVADLVSQATTINDSGMNDIMAASSAVMYPFPTNLLKVTVTSVNIDANGKETILPALARFANQNAANLTTEQAPVQKFWWKDLFAKRGGTYQYRIVPMGGSPGAALTPLAGVDPLLSNKVTLTPQRPPFNVYFNRGITATQAALLGDIANMDLVATMPRLDVPVVMAQGRHDQVAPGEAAERYLGSLQAPSKQLVWFENSAHFPQWEERERFHEFLLTTVLPATADSWHLAGLPYGTGARFLPPRLCI